MFLASLQYQLVTWRFALRVYDRGWGGGSRGRQCCIMEIFWKSSGSFPGPGAWTWEGGTPPSISWMGYPLPRSRQGGYPIQLMGVPPSQVQVGGYPIQLMGGTLPRSRWEGYPIQLTGVPHPANGEVLPQAGGTPHQGSMACTCYAAGGMPLAFTQEDFLVYIVVKSSENFLDSLGYWGMTNGHIKHWRTSFGALCFHYLTLLPSGKSWIPH